jgi:calcineurin-like phosphoesterase family protein
VATFFTSDTHFGDHRTINIHRRPFAAVAEMDAALIDRWNEVVADEDEVWHLGDFARSLRDAERVLGLLRGRKHLIRGNNDPEAVTAHPGWASVRDYHELGIGERLVILCHYPFRAWNGQARGAVNLHGHSHGRGKPLPRQVDVGVDAWDFRPILFDTIAERIGAKAKSTGAKRTLS